MHRAKRVAGKMPAIPPVIALLCINLMKDIEMATPYFEIKPHGSGGYYWVLYGANHEAVCHSESFFDKYGAKRAAERVKELAPTATIKETDTLSGLGRTSILAALSRL